MRGELDQQHRPDRRERAQPLDRCQGLVEYQVSEEGGGERAGEGKEGHRQGRQPLQAAEPQGVGEQGADDAQIAEPGQVGRADRGRQPFEEQRRGEQDEPARGELPAGHAQHAHTRGLAPALGEDEPGAHGGRRCQPGQDPERVQRGLGPHHQQADAGRAE
ncbi:hypothetical protein GCM10028793_31040 [Nocardiopsis oceani]